ncbi:uncharacterized protein F4807DRAFT_461988 [Annulohypoxylon truncatum]|uniref:uncharacterized protein n=1 Tax=Annulohypoxylon truncatum TaxID=327061 RepID=UPI00200843E2|nr:uncharacterized protein F4807DRAFT_461988 [Annulohypoxylon truncatum]KAI1208266.1 hypothetical protein F4807DRAFT_461988 [Annulohypoxylon truncatum]
MRFAATFATLALALSGSAVAQSTEDVSVTAFTLHKADAAGTVDGVSFKLDGKDGKGIDCSATATQITAGVPTAELACSNNKYKFTVLPGTDAATFGLKITHDTISGQGNVALNCRSGGGAAQVCSQTEAAVKISLKA